MAALILILFIMSTMHSANYWAYVSRAFIKRGQTSQSIADALDEYPDWYLAIASVSDANAILADCVIVSRKKSSLFTLLTSTEDLAMLGSLGAFMGNHYCSCDMHAVNYGYVVNDLGRFSPLMFFQFSLLSPYTQTSFQQNSEQLVSIMRLRSTRPPWPQRYSAQARSSTG